MRKWAVVAVIAVSSCGYKAPPPGKPELQGPSVKIISPQPGDTIKDTSGVIFEASDVSKVGRASLMVDGTAITELKMQTPDTVVQGTLRFNSAEYFDGQHKLKVVAYDLWDNRGESREIVVRFLNGRLAEGGRDTVGTEEKKPIPRRGER